MSIGNDVSAQVRTEAAITEGIVQLWRPVGARSNIFDQMRQLFMIVRFVYGEWKPRKSEYFWTVK